ncbi:uncharacterized protein [Parasteatoda tepidariorum]|uniref:uncharacterized protein n=1 Tax=Parasteatoda tepidariorum TaxID=114398 RepID=UPI001C7267FA|nr:uncharacterized protein LOC110282200 [Parasteatoda tepidariorum]
MTELSMMDIDKLEKDIGDSQETTLNLRRKVFQCEKSRKSSSDVLSSDKQVNFFTKLKSIVLFRALLQWLTTGWKPAVKTKLSSESQLLIVFMKLRLGLLNQDLAYRFGVGSATVSRIFREWVEKMSVSLSSCIAWPSHGPKVMPQCFRHKFFQNVVCVIDCSDIFIDTPRNLDARSQTYSNYKHHNTVKFLIACSPDGGIIFLSKLYGGRHSDKEITIDSGFLNLVKSGDKILADRGFRIEEVVGLKGARIVVPAFTTGKSQLSGREVSHSRIISKARVHIERCIRRIKSYRILKSTWPPTYLTEMSAGKSLGYHILTTLGGLCNIAKPSLINFELA